MKILIALYLILSITGQPRRSYEESLKIFSNYCSQMKYSLKLKLINAKKAVGSDEETYKKIEGERFMFIGGGGYSRVFLDNRKNSVIKLIRARKLQRKSSLVSMAIELEMGFFYKIVEKTKGTVEKCEYYLKKVGDRLDMLAFHLDFLDGQDMNDYHHNKKKRRRNNFDQRALFTIKNVLHLTYSYSRLGFMHRDIKPENIFFLTERKKYNIDRVKPILIDLSFTTKEKHSKRFKGTESYMPKEMLIGDKKSDWYNQTVDVFNLGVSFIEFIIYYFNKKSIDFGFMSFIEGMLNDNWCKNFGEDKFTFCDNDALYYEDFQSLKDLAGFFYDKKHNFCENGENDVLDYYVKCYDVDETGKNMEFECRPTMREAKHFLDFYVKWKKRDNHLYNPYRNFFYNNSGLIKYKKFVDVGFLGHMYRSLFPNTYEILVTRVNF